MKGKKPDLEQIYARELARLFRFAERKKMVLPKRTASVSLLPNASLRAMKKRYLKRDMAIVDVLSFPSGGFPDPEYPRNLGEIYVNRTIARREPERGIFLLVHGFLHLLGYRHDMKRDRIRMEKLEKELVSILRKQ